MQNEMITKKDWDAFRATGLFFFVNTILHAFGWALVAEVEDGKVKSCYPARVKFRGFDDESQTEGHIKIANYLSETADQLKEEASS